MPTNMKHCNVCASDVKSLRVSPVHSNHKHSESERACDECWEVYLSLQVEENKPDRIECMFCKSTLDFQQIGKLARQGTSFRYAEKLKVGAICMNRCTKLLQPFDRELNGRVFACKDCGFEACVDCDRPEHQNETCREYCDRLATVHAAAESLTHKLHRSCPSCDLMFDTEKCGFTKCRCGYRFCSGCMIPWVGMGSAYTGGKEAHGENCLYRTRDRPSEHSIKRRFEEPADVQARNDQRDLDNKNKLEAKRARLSTSTEPRAKSSRKRRRQDV